MKRAISLTAVLLLLLAVPVSANVPYDTYGYLHSGERVSSPHAYIPASVHEVQADGLPLSGAADMCVTADGDIYIADTGNDRIVILDSGFSPKGVLHGFTQNGQEERFSGPQGICVTADGVLYVADSGAHRVVGIGADGQAVSVWGKPDTDLLEGLNEFVPQRVDADKYGRVYVVAEDVTMGLLVFDRDEGFTGFLGSQKVAYSLSDYLWKRFMTEAQKQRMQQFVPMTYTNVTCDGSGFVYAVSAAVDTEALAASIDARAYDGRTTPIKKLNAAGMDVLLRTDAYPPVGDILYEKDDEDRPILSSIVDVALGEEGTYTMLDRQRSRMFTYSARGELLYAFGAQSEQYGDMLVPTAIAYTGTSLLTLDRQLGRLTVYARTAYGDALIRALGLSGRYRFDEARDAWEEVLSFYPNSDLAYRAIGLSLLGQENYTEAMRYYEVSGDLTQYSQAFSGYRKQLIGRYPLALFSGALLLLALAVLLIRCIARSVARYAADGRGGLGKQVLYAAYPLFRPIAGYWELIHERRGSKLGGTLILAAVTAGEVLRVMLTDGLFAGEADSNGLLRAVIGTAGVILLFVLANWCLTTLMDGKARMGQIYTVCTYAMLPLLIGDILTVPLSHILLLDEGGYLTFIRGLTVAWVVLLLFCGIMTIQQYGFLKNIGTMVLTAAVMAIVTFLLILLLTTFAQIFTFIRTIFLETIR